jgi:hypothetical protein
MSRTLFELSTEMLEFDDMLESLDDDDSALIERLRSYLEDLSTEVDEKLDRYATLIQEITQRGAVRRTEATRLMQRAKIDENKSQWLKVQLLQFFATHDMKSVETAHFRITRAGNGGKLPVILHIPEEELPADYVRQTTTIKADVDHIREALESGIEVPGAELGQRGFSLRIS